MRAGRAVAAAVVAVGLAVAAWAWLRGPAPPDDDDVAPVSRPRATEEPAGVPSPPVAAPSVEEVPVPAAHRIERDPLLAAAWAALEGLKGRRNARGSTNEEILAALEAVRESLSLLRENADPDAIRFRLAAHRELIDVLGLSRVVAGVDDREEVNVRAAQIVGETEEAELSGLVRSVIERRLRKAPHPVSQRVWDETFAALGRLNDPKSLKWMAENYVHTNNAPAEVAQLVAAHRAMRSFHGPDGRPVEGKLRHEIVRKMVGQYAGTEEQALSGNADPNTEAARQFYERIRPELIETLRHLAGDPKDAEGRPIETVRDFRAWLREHDDPRREPWTH